MLILDQLRLVVLPVIAALFISTLLSKPATWLHQRGWPSLLATWTVMLVVFGGFAGLIAIIAPSMADELADMGTTVRQGSEQVLNWLTQGPLGLTESQIDDYLDQAGERIRANSSVISGGVFTGAAIAIELVAGMLLTVVLVFFFLKDGRQMFSWCVDRFSDRHRPHVRTIGLLAWSTIGGYLRGVAVIGVVNAVLIGVVLLGLGVPLVVPLMMLTFLGAFFPLVGAIVAGAVATLVALVTNGPLDAAFVAGAIVVIQQVEGDVLQPVVMARAVRLHPVVVLVALTAGAVLAGAVGAMLAVPVAAVAASVGSYLRSLEDGDSANSKAAEPAV